MKRIILALLLMLAPAMAWASNCGGYPYTLVNGQVADANQVMSNFNTILNCANNNLAHNGANSDIVQILGLLVPLSTAQGGTGNTTGAPTFSAIANNTVLGNITGGAAIPTATPITSLSAYLAPFTGDTGSGGIIGAVPAPPAGSSIWRPADRGRPCPPSPRCLPAR
jgi:hypothetical protein